MLCFKTIRPSFTPKNPLKFLGVKFLISFYIANSNIDSVYGSAGSFVIIMVWVYYSSVILYFGAQFAKSYGAEYASQIVPSKHAEFVTIVEQENVNQSLNENK